MAQESPDGKWLYFSRQDGVLRRMPLSGGEEVEYVRDLGRPRYSESFFVNAKGVYYVAPDRLIRFIGHSGGEPKTLGSIPRQPGAGLGLSPDGGSLLYSQYDRSTAELMLVENFH